MEGKLADARKAHRAYVAAANSPAGQARDEGRPPERPSARSGAAPAAGHVPRRPRGEIGDVARCLRHHVNVSFGSGPAIPNPRCTATGGYVQLRNGSPGGGAERLLHTGSSHSGSASDRQAPNPVRSCGNGLAASCLMPRHWAVFFLSCARHIQLTVRCREVENASLSQRQVDLPSCLCSNSSEAAPQTNESCGGSTWYNFATVQFGKRLWRRRTSQLKWLMNANITR